MVEAGSCAAGFKLCVSGGAAGSAHLPHSRSTGTVGGPQTLRTLYFTRVIHYQTAALHEAFPVPLVLLFCQQNRFCFHLCKAEPRYGPFSREERIFVSHLYSLWDSGPRAMSYYGNLSGKGKLDGFSQHRLPLYSPKPK